MLTQFVVVLCFWGYAHTAVSDLRLPDDDNRQPKNWQINQYKPKLINYQRSHLIKKALDLLDKEKNNEKTIAINKCLYKNYELRNRLKCVKELISRTNSKREYYNYNPIYNKFSDEYDDYYDFQDLTKLGRSYKIYKNFSQDYLDVNDLLRTASNKQKNTKKRYVLKVVQPNKYNRFDYDLTRFRKFNRYDKTNILRTNSESSETEENDKLRTQNNIFDKRYIEDSEESSSSEDTEKEGPKLKEPTVIYMQSPSHIYGANSRRRLPHFLPKRFHWTEDEMKDLTNYWFNGPQGKYWGLYKTPY